MNDQKSIYRTEAMRHRERMDIRDESTEAATQNFLKSAQPQKGDIVAGYWPKGREFDTSDILHTLLELGCVVCLPIIRKGSRVLDFARWDGGAPLVSGPYDVLQPAEPLDLIMPDIVIVPMLAFDRRGHRLGYGGGYYDATLAHLRSLHSIKAIGLAYSQQAVLFNLPADEHDQKMDMVITPAQVYTFADAC